MAKRVAAIGRHLSHYVWLLPAVSLGLFASRVVSEWVTPSLLGAFIITLASILVSLILLRRTSIARSWPATLLLLYVFYPDPNLMVASAVALLSFGTVLLSIDRLAYESFISPQVQTLVGLVFVGISFFLLYLVTLAPGMLPADSGEFQLVAAKLGVAHPPGFPLYTVIAHLFTQLPLGPTAASRVNLLSALISTLTLLLVYLSVYELTSSVAASILSSLALGTTTTFWSQATTANIRGLNAFFIALALLTLLKLAGETLCLAKPIKSTVGDFDSKQTSPVNATNDNGRRTVFYLLLFLLSLSLGVSHHGSLLFIGLIFILVLFLSRRDLFSRAYWPYFLLALVVGLLPLAYLLWRGAAGAVGAPDNITTTAGFLNHVLARGFRGDLLYFDESWILWERLKVMRDVYLFQFSTILFVASLVGLVLMLLHNRLLFLLIGGSLVLFTLIAAIYRAPQTVEYLLPAYVLAAVGLGYLAGLVRREQFSKTTKDRIAWLKLGLAPLFIALLYVVALGQAYSRFPSFEVLHRDLTARDYAQSIFDRAPKNATILADWHWATPLWYLQLVEGVRPDLDIQYVFPTSEPYAETWARRIGEGIASGHPVVATHYDEAAYQDLPPFEPLAEAFLYPAVPRTTLPETFTAQTKTIDEAIELLGYTIESSDHDPAKEMVVTIVWQPSTSYSPARHLFLHLVDKDGQLFAQQDIQAISMSDGLTLSQFRLTPRLDTPAGDYDLLVGSYDPTRADRQPPSRQKLTEIFLSMATIPPYTANPTYRKLINNGDRWLIGLDWDNTRQEETRAYLHYRTPEGFATEIVDLESDTLEIPAYYGPWGLEQTELTIKMDPPARYVPFGQGIVWTGQSTGQHPSKLGTTLSSDQQFSSSRPVLRDLIVSLRLVGYEEDGFHWNWWDLDDGVPAMGAIPTLKWIGGSNVRDPNRLTISDRAWPGQAIEPLLRLYDAFTGRPLPILDERIEQETPWIPLGKTLVEP